MVGFSCVSVKQVNPRFLSPGEMPGYENDGDIPVVSAQLLTICTQLSESGTSSLAVFQQATWDFQEIFGMFLVHVPTVHSFIDDFWKPHKA
jgi:hypothetical protein